MKKIFFAIFTILLIGSLSYADVPDIHSKSAILINANTGEILYDKQADVALPPASTTKIMTALLIIENHKLDEIVDVGANFVNPGGSHIAIDHNEKFTVEQLLYALLVESANDAAHALAEFDAGTEEAFVDKMNEKAIALGADDSHFASPHGLDMDGHICSPHDLAIIASAAMKEATFRQIVKTARYTIPPTNVKSETRDYIKNNNIFVRDTGKEMLYKNKKIKIYDPRVEGIKTGYTGNAGYCLVSSLSQNGIRYISVILGAESKQMLYSESKLLLDHALEDFKTIRLVAKGEVVKNIKVPNAEHAGLNLVAERSVIRTVPSDFDNDTSLIEDIKLYELKEQVIKRGMPLGKLTFKSGDEIIDSVEIVAQRDVETRDLVGEVSYALATKNPFDSPADMAMLAAKIALSLVLWRFLVVSSRRRKAKKERTRKLKEIRKEIAKEQKKKSNVIKLKNNKTKN